MNRKEIAISGAVNIEGIEYHYEGHAGYCEDGSLVYVNIEKVIGPDGEFSPIIRSNPLFLDIWLHANASVWAMMELQNGRKM